MPIWSRRPPDDDWMAGSGDPELEKAVDALGEGLDKPLHMGDTVGGEDVYTGVAAIQSADPSFNARAFLSTVEGVFLNLQRAWAGGNDTPDPHYVNPGFARAWTSMLAGWRARQAPVIFDSAGPPRITMQRVETDPNWDRIVVRITAPPTPGAPFGEFRHRWTFIRYHIADVASSTIAAQTCPTCGGPFSADEKGHCKYCGAALSGGVFDWRITDVADVTFGDPSVV